MKLRPTAFTDMYNCVTTENRVVGHVQMALQIGDPDKRWIAYLHKEEGDICIGYASTASQASDLIPH